MEIELCTNETSECVCGHTQKRHGIKSGIGIVLKVWPILKEIQIKDIT